MSLDSKNHLIKFKNDCFFDKRDFNIFVVLFINNNYLVFTI